MTKVAFFSNYINHHQLPFSKDMVVLTNNSYKFISQKAISEKRISLGYKNISNDYEFVVRTYENENEKKMAYQLANDAQYVIFGATKDEYFINRLKNNKITFEYSERLNKTELSFLLYIKKYISLLIHRRQYRNKKLYLLCSGVYVANDYFMFNTYKNKMYKWGYFPEYIEYDIDKLIDSKSNETISILWAGRLIDWKHPEYVIELGKALNKENIGFKISIIGSGELEDKITELIKNNNLENKIEMLGSMPPSDVRKVMEKSNIFVFTSNRHEGWGAVLNEAMNSGCACVVSHAIGSAGFMIKNGENGYIYEDGNINDLVNKAKILFNKEERNKIAKNAYLTIKNEWNSKIAAERFLVLAKNLDEGKDTPYIDGPCSKAIPIKDKKMYSYLLKK